MRKDSDAGAAGSDSRVATAGAALAAGIFTVAVMTSAAVISSMSHQFELSDLGKAALYLSFAVVGVIVAWHQPRNPMGWVLPPASDPVLGVADRAQRAGPPLERDGPRAVL
jgi:hypothetical protein